MADYDVLVAGAGYSGARLLALLPPGSALGLGRSGGDGLLAVDLDGEAPTLPGARAVVYTVPPPAEGEDDPRLGRFLAALPTAPERIVYFSTSGVYGDCRGARVVETAPRRPGTPRAVRRAAAEERLEAWCRERGSLPVILRVPGIYGPGRLGLERLRQGGPVLREADAGPGNRIHVDDLVACARAAAAADGPPAIVNVGDGDYRSASWFSGEVARQAGLPAPREIDREQARREFSRMRLSFLAESRRVDVTRMRERLGIAPRRPEDGIADSLRAGRD